MRTPLLGLLITLLSLNPLRAHAALTYSTTDFTTLFNHYRYAQAAVLPWPATYWPFSTSDSGSGINNIPPGQTESPAQKYDDFFNPGGSKDTSAAVWEEANHSCANVDQAHRDDCISWYGHCNGWTGASLFNAEPDYNQVFNVTNPSNGAKVSFNFVDVKALLTEAWLDVSVSYEGTSSTVAANDWIFSPTSAIAQQTSANNSSLTNYEAYWDVTPRAFFYALTNYIGEQKLALAMDRFTGSQVWNQPVMGYRLLPITGNTSNPIAREGQQLYPVTLGVKVYWANDEVPDNFKRTASLNWDVSNSSFSTDKIPDPPTDLSQQDSVSDNAVNSRYLSFTLFFDAPVVVSADGTVVQSAGKIVGDGLWSHSDSSLMSSWYPYGYELSQTHPDFLWRPDSFASRQYRNPNVDPLKIYQFILQKPAPID